MKALKVTISGSYKTAQGDIIDFEDVSGVIPFVDEDHAFMHIKSRHAASWIKSMLKENGEKMYGERIEKIRQVFMDDIEEVKADFSYVGKDIKQMSYDELQDLATAKDLRYIPLPKFVSGFSLRETRVRAYVAYSDKILDKIVDENEEGFNFASLPALIVDGDVRMELSGKITNDEVLDQVAKEVDISGKTKSLSLDELKNIADKKGIKYHWNIGHDKLYNMLYGGAS